MNCWEAKNCQVKETCAAFYAKSLNGFLGGYNGGKACFFILGTRYEGKLQETKEEKERVCRDCDFFNFLKNEHGEIVSDQGVREYLRSKMSGLNLID